MATHIRPGKDKLQTKNDGHIKMHPCDTIGENRSTMMTFDRTDKNPHPKSRLRPKIDFCHRSDDEVTAILCLSNMERSECLREKSPLTKMNVLNNEIIIDSEPGGEYVADKFGAGRIHHDDATTSSDEFSDMGSEPHNNFGNHTIDTVNPEVSDGHINTESKHEKSDAWGSCNLDMNASPGQSSSTIYVSESRPSSELKEDDHFDAIMVNESQMSGSTPSSSLTRTMNEGKHDEPAGIFDNDDGNIDSPPLIMHVDHGKYTQAPKMRFKTKNKYGGLDDLSRKKSSVSYITEPRKRKFEQTCAEPTYEFPAKRVKPSIDESRPRVRDNYAPAHIVNSELPHNMNLYGTMNPYGVPIPYGMLNPYGMFNMYNIGNPHVLANPYNYAYGGYVIPGNYKTCTYNLC